MLRKKLYPRISKKSNHKRSQSIRNSFLKFNIAQQYLWQSCQDFISQLVGCKNLNIKYMAPAPCRTRSSGGTLVGEAETETQTKGKSKMAKITCGVNAAENASFNGMTITQVMEQYGQFFNIPNDNLVVLVNDEEVSNMSYIICSDDDVEFVKSAGEKGAARQASAPLKSLKDIRKENVKRRNVRSVRQRNRLTEKSRSCAVDSRTTLQRNNPHDK
eukprot:TRINITY_DN1786_c0_g1_i17.p1 TRINITY_DN1786_c0_g1~~TRINITY_DN1786_c0_g1_i17.p1  ORF type:complete len:216 (+),score=17.55 TRINITY_DN1786_c0_g1_i17:573-1220(+)